MHFTRLKRLFLYALIGSVGLSAILGILAILIGDFGEFEIRILLTTLVISGASLCGLSCGAGLEAGRNRNLPIGGIALAITAAVMVIVGLWSKAESEVYWKSSATVSIFAVAVSHVALLLLARLAPGFAWAKWAAYAIVFSLAATLTVLLWGEVNEMPWMRLLGVLAILDGAISIVTPILHRLSRRDQMSPQDASTVSLAEIDHEIACLRSRLEELETQRLKILSAT